MGIRTELTLRLPNSPGAAAGVCRLLADERVSILAMMIDTGGRLHLIVDNHVRALGALRDTHHQVAVRDVIVTAPSNRAGGLAPILALVGEAGFNIEYAYGGAGDAAAGGVVALGVDDAARAAAATGL